MVNSNAFRELFYLVTLILLPMVFIGIRRLSRQNASWDDDQLVKNRFVVVWLCLLSFVLVERGIAGVLLLAGTNVESSLFFPIRIAGPNWAIVRGLPYLGLCACVLAFLPSVGSKIAESRGRYFLIFGFAAALSLAFGAIHGGFAGNIGVADSPDHWHDANLNASAWDTMATHVDRIAGKIGPPYLAPHSLSHPAPAVVYWQILGHYLPLLGLSVVNVLLYSLTFPALFWALRRRVDPKLAIQVTLGCMLVPGLLIYGRSDDAVYYGIAGAALAIFSVALAERRFGLTAAAGALVAAGANVSYAAVVLMPAMLSFTADIPLPQTWHHLRRILPHALIMIVIVFSVIVLVDNIFGFDLWASFRASVYYNRATHITSLLDRGAYGKALSDRLMAWGDFPLFAGPVLLFAVVERVRSIVSNHANFRLNDLALAVLLLVLATNSSGAGEIARPWGSIYLLAAFSFLPNLMQTYSENMRWWLLRAQFIWALLLQACLNFIW